MSSSLPPVSTPSPSVSESTSVEATAAAHQQRRASRSSLPPVSSIKRFPKIKLTAEEQAHYDRVVGRLLYRAVQEYANYSGSSENAAAKIDHSLWTQVRKNRDMNVFKSVKGPGNPRVSLLLGLGKIEGSLEDVMDGLYSDSSMDYSTEVGLLTSRFIAGAVLHVSEKHTPDDPFNLAAIKWFAMRTPGGSVSSNRDLLYYTRHGMTFDAEGNEVAYHLMQSVDRPEWPANAFKNLVRSHVSICYLYKRSKNKVKTFFWGEFYGSGSTPQLVLNYTVAGKWLAVKNALKVSEAKKLFQLRQAARSRASTCSITIDDISCSEDKKVFELDARGRPMKDRFCVKCLVQVAKQRGSRISWDGRDAEQPPAFFDLAFQTSSTGRSMLDSISSTMSLLTNGSSVIDTSYMEESQEQLDKESSGLEDTEWEHYEKRKRSYAERLSRSSSFSNEQFLSDLFDKMEFEK